MFRMRLYGVSFVLPVEKSREGFCIGSRAIEILLPFSIMWVRYGGVQRYEHEKGARAKTLDITCHKV